MEFVNFWIIIGASLLGGLTPGPATLAIAGTSMARGRTMGLALAWGVTGGSMVWAIFAALGFGAILAANQWLVEIIRYAGAAYFAWLGYKAARSAVRAKHLETKDIGTASHLVAWTKGALIHLTNPKAVIFWGSIFAIGLQPGAHHGSIAWVVGTCVAINFVLVTAYALLFSSRPMTQAYLRARRWLEAAFAAFFGGAAYYLLANRTT
ncbi:LysE family translocator [Yoonia litorea]|uniref:Threonine/homoserine/homoserine lactone efflux protein n=1 Tax=Yoonia litorea TaxID=1123755 RepID=A0A1I6L0I3_9RHOB|nr:LysE family translocator [Yoonia litorea]SFR96710.1 Threonine/homoserine/homoserine lactone efflux protein [Yoonia litorea]